MTKTDGTVQVIPASCVLAANTTVVTRWIELIGFAIGATWRQGTRPIACCPLPFMLT